MLVRFKPRKKNRKFCNVKMKKIQKGVYLIKNGWVEDNFHLVFNMGYSWNKPNGIHKTLFFGEIGNNLRLSSGFADNLEQILKHYPELKDNKRKFIMILHKVSKYTHDYRWRKWGEYIGNEKQKTERLSEEEGFKKPFLAFHIYEVDK